MEDGDRKKLCEIPWSRGQRLICSISTFHEKPCLDIRLHYYDPDTKDWLPTKKGIWVPIEKAKDFHKLIMYAFDRLNKGGTEITKPNDNNIQVTIPHIEGKPKQPPENDSEKERTGLTENNPDDDPEKLMDEFLRPK